MEDDGEFLGRDDFELGEGAALRAAVGTPAAEESHVAEAAGLRVFVGDFDNELGTEGFPRQVFAIAPAALRAGHAVGFVLALGTVFDPVAPWVVGKRILPIRCEKLDKFTTFRPGKAGADADVLQYAGVVEAEQ